MWIASLIIGSGEFLAWSNTEASSHLMGQRLFQACAAMADLSVSCFLHASLCSLKSGLQAPGCLTDDVCLTTGARDLVGLEVRW